MVNLTLVGMVFILNIIQMEIFTLANFYMVKELVKEN